MEKLAIFGGKPVRETKIYYGQQNINEDDVNAVVEVLKSPYLTQGPKVIELEYELCLNTGAKYCSVVSNGTAALHLACLSIGVKEGDEVIVTPMTFAASANCILYCGGTPVFADIDLNTYNISVDSIRKKISEKTKAIIAVDFTGTIVEVEEIRKICDENNLIFIEDASHSLGGIYKEKKVGSLADITTFSFHPVKTITGGEGGAITTNSKEIHEKISLYRTHGITKENQSFINCSEGEWYQEQQVLGYNYRITDFQAALILSQLHRLDHFKKKRAEIIEIYNTAFSNMKELTLQKETNNTDPCKHLYVLQLNFDYLTCTRKQFFDAMAAENIQPQVHYIPTYYFPYYQNLGYQYGLCPNAEKLYLSLITIPLYPSLTLEEVNDVIHCIKKLCAYYSVNG